MFRTLAAIAMIAAALPGTAIACGIPTHAPVQDGAQAAPIDRPETPRANGTADLPLGAWLSEPRTGMSRCGTWQASLLAQAAAGRQRRPGANAARDTATRR
ncbi:hypothetical protein GXW78_14945 [Roseomonas terrae]|jgi:hypothetical protein|uniref:Uncharacterized protein n=1 Tax=Neoroseomonas terrae TaxID=424799 RepID=A0ABS5EIW3_9PROT|nr:hypothetical protein [Neoroseomonas terrae]MBR0650968.1 hypothetical protein [Neoroseomonas terrae]